MADVVSGPACDGIPDKLYFKIGEVAALVGVQPHVLRYWEKEIALVRPAKSTTNQRRYRRRDVEIFREVRRLLYEERYTLAGARKRVLGLRAGPEADTGDVAVRVQADLPAPVVTDRPTPEVRQQLALGFRVPAHAERLDKVRAGLRELIALAGEEP